MDVFFHVTAVVPVVLQARIRMEVTYRLMLISKYVRIFPRDVVVLMASRSERVVTPRYLNVINGRLYYCVVTIVAVFHRVNDTVASRMAGDNVQVF